MTEIKTDEALLDALRRASTRKPSAAEIDKQRVSFIMGMLPHDSAVTRERVREVLNEYEGKKAS